MLAKPKPWSKPKQKITPILLIFMLFLNKFSTPIQIIDAAIITSIIRGDMVIYPSPPNIRVILWAIVKVVTWINKGFNYSFNGIFYSFWNRSLWSIDRFWFFNWENSYCFCYLYIFINCFTFFSKKEAKSCDYLKLAWFFKYRGINNRPWQELPLKTV